MNRPFYAVATAVSGIIAAVAVVYTIGGFGSGTTTPAPALLVSDVVYDVAQPARTELCVDGGVVMRNWTFVNRWMKNQLSHDTYVVDGTTYNAFRVVTDDPTLPKQHVRFRKVIVDIGDGPTLEGHSYLNTRVDGKRVKMERGLLFVEFNGRLERQRRPLPACGTPRS